MPPGAAALVEHRVIAEMRIAVDHAETAERKPPGGEHRLPDAVALRELGAFLCVSSLVPSSQSSVSSRPVESSGHTSGTRIRSMPLEHRAIERGVLCLAPVVELLAHARGDLLADLAWCRSPGPCGDGSRIGAAVAAHGDLAAGLDSWQKALVDYATQQGFTVKE